MVYRVYVEKKQGLEAEAKSLRYDIRHLLGIKSLTDVRIVNRYDVENIEKDLFDYAVKTVFSEPQLDNVSSELNFGDATVFAVEFLPGQFDQRANSLSECLQILTEGARPISKSAKIYVLKGNLSDEDVENIKITLMFLIKNGLLVEINQEEFLLPETLECIGSETSKAELMRRKREREKNFKLSGNNVTKLLPSVTKSYTEKEIDKEKDIETESEKEKEGKSEPEFDFRERGIV